MDTHAVFTATVLAAIVGTLVMAVYAKKPFGLAPGMGLNAFFVFTEIHGLVDVPPSVSPIFCQFDFSNVFSIDMVVIVFTFLFIDMFDTMGTLVGVCTKAGMMKPDGRIHGLNKAFMADAVATVAGACFGTSTTTTYVALRVLHRGSYGSYCLHYCHVLRSGPVLRTTVPVSSFCSNYSCARHRGSVYDVAYQGHRPERLC